MVWASSDEKRQAARIEFDGEGPSIQYKFLSHLDQFQCDSIFSGSALNLSSGGALFVGPVPGQEWLPQLSQGVVLLGLNIDVPNATPVKALASLKWTRRGEREESYQLGVQFEQVDAAHRSTLEKFLSSHKRQSRRLRIQSESRRLQAESES